MGEAYVPYPMLESFSQEAHSPQASDDSQSLPSAQSVAKGAKLRRHAACDECRKRKLKCTGEPQGCTRCVKNGIPCIYSEQKQMGRPRKRQKTDDGLPSPVLNESINRIHALPPQIHQQPQPQPQPQSQVEALLETPIDPSLANIDHDLTNFHNVCTAPLAQTIRNQREADAFKNMSIQPDVNIFEHNSDVTSLDHPYTRYPTDISQWPDFSTIDKLPLPLTTRYDPDTSNDLSYTELSAPSIDSLDTKQLYSDPDVDPSALSALPSIPSCPCLPNLYLALSTLSTLSNFPVSQQTIDTLLSAQKTARAVIYCPVCPQKYQSGSQNLMLGCTLLNVVSDHWHRVRNTSADVLKKGFSTQPTHHHHHLDPALNGTSPPAPVVYVTVKEGLTWRGFARQLIRAYVFGDSAIPKIPSPSPPTPTSLSISTSTSPPPETTGPKVLESNTLSYLIRALERRQRQWHRLDPPTDEFPDRMMHDLPSYYGGPGYGPNFGPAESQRKRKKRRGSKSGNGKSNAEAGEENTNGNGLKTRKTSHPHCHQHDDDDSDEDDESHPIVCLALVRHAKNILAALDDSGK